MFSKYPIFNAFYKAVFLNLTSASSFKKLNSISIKGFVAFLLSSNKKIYECSSYKARRYQSYTEMAMRCINHKLKLIINELL